MSGEVKGKGKIILIKWNLLWIGTIDIIILLIAGIFFTEVSIYSIGIIGIVTFIGTLKFLNLLSGDAHIEQGEIRKAITISFIVVYFSLLSLVILENFGRFYTGVFQTLIDHFTYLVGIVVVFYFGSRSVEEYLKNKKERQMLKQEHEMQIQHLQLHKRKKK
jgi:hypothetical protein